MNRELSNLRFWAPGEGSNFSYARSSPHKKFFFLMCRCVTKMRHLSGSSQVTDSGRHDLNETKGSSPKSEALVTQWSRSRASIVSVEANACKPKLNFRLTFCYRDKDILNHANLRGGDQTTCFAPTASGGEGEGTREA